MDLCTREGIKYYTRTPPPSFPFPEFNDSAWHRSVSGRSSLSCRVPVGTTHGAIPLLNSSFGGIKQYTFSSIRITVRGKICLVCSWPVLIFFFPLWANYAVSLICRKRWKRESPRENSPVWALKDRQLVTFIFSPGGREAGRRRPLLGRVESFRLRRGTYGCNDDTGKPYKRRELLWMRCRTGGYVWASEMTPKTNNKTDCT